MPKPMQYKANSVVYFRGDIGDKIYILKSGKVSLRYNDIETGQEIRDLIQTGEFFGVKSALGRYPREETAMVLQDSDMLVFTVPEFEALVSKNTRIITKMLTVFSNQLRRIHRQVQNLLSAGRSAPEQNPEQGLYKIAMYYMKAKKYRQALYVFQRYLTYYPSGAFSADATRNIGQIEQFCSGNQSDAPRATSGSASFAVNTTAAVLETAPAPEPTRAPVRDSRPEDLSAAARQYYVGVGLFSQQKFQDALRIFKKIVDANEDIEYVAKSQYEIGRCMYSMSNFDSCIKHYTQFFMQYPKHPDCAEALYYVGNCHEKKGNLANARGCYDKILRMSKDSLPVYRRAKKAMKRIDETAPIE